MLDGHGSALLKASVLSGVRPAGRERPGLSASLCQTLEGGRAPRKELSILKERERQTPE